MAIQYPNYPSIPRPINPLDMALSGLQEGFGAARQGVQENRTVDGFGKYLDATGYGTQAPMSLAALGGKAGQPEAATAPVAARRPAAAIPQGDRASYIRNGLIQRGLPEHVADGFLANFQDESGLDPSINEKAPLVPGSRGGFGLYQLTGPRRRMYEAFARDKGVDPSDIDAQLDWLKFELGGPEARAAKSIMAAPDTGSAAQAIVNNFLRPSPEHRASRSQRYAGLGGGVQVASADGSGPSAETMNALMGGAAGAQAALGEVGATANAPFPQFTPQQPARQMLPDRETMLELFRNPNTRPLAIDIAKRAQTGAAPQETYSTIERQDGSVWQMNNLSGQLTRVGDARSPERGVTVGNDIVDPTTGRMIYDGPDEAPKPIAIGGALVDPTTGREVYRSPADEPDPFTLGTGQIRFDAAGNEVARGPEKAAENGITIGPDGTVQIGGSGMKLTEGQSKDLNYYVRGNAALGTIEKNEAALASGGQRFLDGVPVGGNYLTSPEYQVATQAGREFLASILRKDTGAAITQQEEEIYGKMFLPQPGDGPEVIEQKRATRLRALEAMKAGLGTATPLANTPVTQNPTSAPAEGAPRRRRYNPETGVIE